MYGVGLHQRSWICKRTLSFNASGFQIQSKRHQEVEKVKQVSLLYVLPLMTQYIFSHHKICVVHYSFFRPKSLPFLCEIFHMVNVGLLELKWI